MFGKVGLIGWAMHTHTPKVNSWSVWIVYHDWKLQIRKEIKEAKSEEEKSDLSTDQYFGRISLLKNPIDTRLDGLEP